MKTELASGETSSTNSKKAFKVQTCNYLVVGAGTTGMSFIDTILSENTTATVVLVDRNTKPGGHWVHSYPFVRLHQQSCSYGVNSVPLGKNLNSKGHEKYDVYDRAMGSEVVDYYERVCEQFKASGRVQCFFGVEYKFDKITSTHMIISCDKDKDKKDSFVVTCDKVVTVSTNISVPSTRKPLIPVHDRVHFISINELTSSIRSRKYKKYIVFGNGKTGCDAIVHLLDHEIDQSQITWIVSRDVWYWLRDVLKDLKKSMLIFKRGMQNATSVEESFRSFEDDGLFCRLDPSRPYPTVFKGPIIDQKELDMMRTIEHVVRLGRAISIEENKIVLDKGCFDFSTDDTLLVDCMNDKWIEGLYPGNFTIFQPGRINIGPLLTLFNSSSTSSIIAFLECALDDDESKNNCCYFRRGPYSIPTTENFIGQIYLSNKSINALKKVPGGGKFFLNSRTTILSPQHHKGGMLGFLWFMFGPQKFSNFSKQLETKIESKRFSDIDHCFGIESFFSEE